MPTLLSRIDGPRAAADGDLPLASETVLRLPIALQVTNVVRSLGYPPGVTLPPPVVQSLEQIMADADLDVLASGPASRRVAGTLSSIAGSRP